MKLIFVGPQASGKGTQAKRVSNEFGLCHISTGDLLRGVTVDLKLKVMEYLDVGKFVPDELIVDILKEKISECSCKAGFILDGFPRTLRQAKELKNISEIDKIIEIAIDDVDAVR